MSYETKHLGKYKFIEEGEGEETLVLLHGLLGNLSNFNAVINAFKSKYKVVVPLLPLYDLDLFHTSVKGLQRYVSKFLRQREYKNIHLIGNSLGGHIALLVSLNNRMPKLKSLILTGSSGLYENALGGTYPKRRSYEYVTMQAQSVFYDPAIATKELIDEVFDITSNRIKALKTVYLARSAMKTYMGDKLGDIKIPTLLIWGENDIVTPIFVANEFNKKIPNSILQIIPKCGHAPMMEVPDAFNKILGEFIVSVQ